MIRALALAFGFAAVAAAVDAPNILMLVADDWGGGDAGCYGNPDARTPVLDALAARGLRCDVAIVPAPQCAPSRAALLTGRHIWQLAEAGVHASVFPPRFATLPDRLQQAGWWVGWTGKGWGPGDWKVGGRASDPCGPVWNGAYLNERRPDEGIANKDYAANYRAFLDARPVGAAAFFWFGCHEPHRGYTAGAGGRDGFTVTRVPGHLPDTPEIRSDLADYHREVAWMDRQLGEMLAELERRGERERTLVIATSDNGRPFPGAKATCRDAGIRVPLIISGPGVRPGVCATPVSLVDLAPTIAARAGLAWDADAAGRDRAALLTDEAGRARDADVPVGFERHSLARADDAGYPVRGLRTLNWLYLRNSHPERWPAGDPPRFGDIDSGPSKSVVLALAGGGDGHPATAHRPAEELYDLTADPACLRNLAEDPAQVAVRAELRERLAALLRAQGDPRELGEPGVFERAPRTVRGAQEREAASSR